MKFLDTGEKIKRLRKELNIRQEDLNAVGVSRNFISMIENGKRKLPKHVAFRIMQIFRNKTDELGIRLDYDDQWLMKSAKDQAVEFCIEKLKSSLSSGDIDMIAILVRDYNIRELIPEVFIYKANKLYDERLYEEAFIYYYDILEYLNETGEEKAFIYNKLGKCKIMMLNYIEAIKYLKKCYVYSLENDDKNNRRNCLYNMSLSYKKLGSIELSLNYIDEFLGLCDITKNFNEYMGGIILKSNCYIELKKYNEAINTLKPNIDKFIDSEDTLLGYIYNSLGVLYLNIENFDIAINYLNKAQYIRELKDTYNLSQTILNKAEIFMKQGNLEVALQLSNIAINLAKQNKNHELIIKCCELLEKIYNIDNKQIELKNIYLEMLSIFSILDRKNDALKTYIKLLKIAYDSDNISDLRFYLKDATKLL